MRIPETEEQRLKDAFMDMLNQACGEWDGGKFKGYDSMCLSAYESALALAVEFGWIKRKRSASMIDSFRDNKQSYLT